MRSHAGAWEQGDSVFSPGTEMHSAVPMGLRASGSHDPGNELPGYFRVSPWDRYGVDFQAPPSAVMKNKYAPGIFVSLNISNSSQGAVIRVQEAESGCGFINSVWRSMNP